MGNSNNKQFKVLQPLDLSIWKKIVNNTNHTILLKNLKTGELIQQHTVEFEENFEQQIRTYQMRTTINQYIVKIINIERLYTDNQHSIIKVRAQYIPFKLSNIQNLSIADNLYVFMSCLIGFNTIYNLTGYFPINSQLIGFTPFGKVKVWLNQNYSRNRKKIKKQIRGNQAHKMIYQLTYHIQQHCLNKRFPQKLKKILVDQCPNTFTECFNLLQQFIKLEKITIPDRIELVKYTLKIKQPLINKNNINNRVLNQESTRRHHTQMIKIEENNHFINNNFSKTIIKTPFHRKQASLQLPHVTIQYKNLQDIENNNVISPKIFKISEKDTKKNIQDHLQKINKLSINHSKQQRQFEYPIKSQRYIYENLIYKDQKNNNKVQHLNHKRTKTQYQQKDTNMLIENKNQMQKVYPVNFFKYKKNNLNYQIKQQSSEIQNGSKLFNNSLITYKQDNSNNSSSAINKFLQQKNVESVYQTSYKQSKISVNPQFIYQDLPDQSRKSVKDQNENLFLDLPAQSKIKINSQNLLPDLSDLPAQSKIKVNSYVDAKEESILSDQPFSKLNKVAENGSQFTKFCQNLKNYKIKQQVESNKFLNLEILQLKKTKTNEYTAHFLAQPQNLNQNMSSSQLLSEIYHDILKSPVSINLNSQISGKSNNIQKDQSLNEQIDINKYLNEMPSYQSLRQKLISDFNSIIKNRILNF